VEPGERLVPIVDDLVRALHRAVAEPGLVIRLTEHDRPEQLRARGLDRPFTTGAFDFVLRPARRAP
jgi:hypothetical protein